MTQSETSAEATPTARRRRLGWLILPLMLVLLVALFYIGGGWFFSSQVHSDALAAGPYDPATLENGTVTAVELAKDGTGVITVRRDAEDADETKFLPAEVGLKIGEVLLVAGPATKTAGAEVTRPVLSRIGTGPVAVGDRAGLARDVWLDPAQAGMPYRTVDVRDAGGARFPAWLVPGSDQTKWAVLVHGKGAARSEPLRMGRALHAAGYNLLLVSYTNDDGAPQTNDGMVHYGATEWSDLQAAINYAIGQGAQRVVLGGLSHGGAVVLGFMRNSLLADRVAGMILDAPASSLRRVLDEAADRRKLPVVGLPIPESLENVAFWIASHRYSIQFDAIDYTAMSGLVSVPVLVFQGTEDRTVPAAVNELFARRLGGDATYVPVQGADHLLSWNVNPREYEAAERRFLRAAGL